MDSDSRDDTRTFKLIMMAVCGFLISLVTSCQELKFTMWGNKADAKVVSIKEVMVQVGRRSTDEPRIQVEFTYTDGGNQIKGRDQLPLDWDLGDAKPGDTIKIEYMAGDKLSARVEGHRNLSGVYFFIAMFVVLVLLFIKASYDAKRPL